MPRRRKKKTRATAFVGYAMHRCYEARAALRALLADAAHAHTPAYSAARPAVACVCARPTAGNTGKEEEADGKGEYIASAVHSPAGKCCFATTSVLQISPCP